MKFWVNLVLSLAIGALCVYLAWPPRDHHEEIRLAFVHLKWGWLFAFIGTLAGVHFLRCWRWDFLLRPFSARIPLRRLIPISSVGFMAIIALPFRLGEVVRPYLIHERGKLRMSTALGTVAVERVVDGLLISLFVFFSCLARRGEDAPEWMMPVAWGSLAIFAAATLFLVAGMLWPERACRFAIRLSLLPRISPRAAARIERSLVGICTGFRALADGRNLGLFLLVSLAYWILNGIGMWMLARGFDLDLSLIGAFATMGLIGVGISLPNPPGNLGLFHYASLKGLALYLPATAVRGSGLAYTLVLHAVQLLWYVLIGCLSLLSSHTSFSRVLRVSRAAADQEESSASGAREAAA